MAKIHINLTCDDGLITEAKKRTLNLSEFFEQKLYERLKYQDVKIKESLKCEFCEREGTQETKEDIKLKGHFKEPNKLTWLFPDEKWICNTCLRQISKNITK